MKNISQNNITPYQLKMPLEISKIIEISDPVYTFCEVMDHIDLNKYLAVKESRIGRPRYDSEKLLKVILFAFMENGYCSVREIEKLCKTDIRFMWLLDEDDAPSFMTIDNFMNETLNRSIETILAGFIGYEIRRPDSITDYANSIFVKKAFVDIVTVLRALDTHDFNSADLLK